ncbi:MAG TPA: tetratricopeptide repeat protein [Fimbriiglobus sp.]|nr:tetratricopeptide repeat protein [Fimbriiglobus sp.]
MTSFRRLAVLAVGGLLSAVAVAQIDAAQGRDDATAARPTAPAVMDPAAERSEDIEVLRRILNNSLGLPNKAVAQNQMNPFYSTAQPSGFGGGGLGGFGGQPGGLGGFGGHGGYGLGGTALPTFISPNPFIVAQPGVSPFDGVYLAGHGVVFTLKVPEQAGVILDPPSKAVGLTETCSKCHATEPISRDALEPTLGTTKAPTEWDRTRQELRGGKPPAEPSAKGPGKLTRQQICEPGNLTERLISKLWQNAKHVRRLPAGERVTVVVTFDGVSGSARDRLTIDPSALPSVQPRPDPKGPTGRAGFTPEEEKQLTLGELHLKQNKPKEAAAAFERVLAQYKQPVYRVSVMRVEDSMKALAREAQKEVRAAYAKLAQAHLAAGDTDKAAAALDMARKFTVELAAAPSKEGAVPVPAKLVISVARADLDKAGDLTAFKKAVRVELTGFPPADKK